MESKKRTLQTMSPLKIGNVEMQNPLVLAPMAGVPWPPLMAVMVKVLLPSFQAEVNPPLNWNRLVLLIELVRSLTKTALTPLPRVMVPLIKVTVGLLWI